MGDERTPAALARPCDDPDAAAERPREPGPPGTAAGDLAAAAGALSHPGGVRLLAVFRGGERCGGLAAGVDRGAEP